jgi:ribosomal protein S19E (S16A)
MRKKVGVNGMRKHYSTGARRGTRKPHGRAVAGKNIRYCINQLATAGIIASVNLQGDDGSSIPVGKALTKKGTTDMDRIASALIKEANKLRAEEDLEQKLRREQAAEAVAVAAAEAEAKRQ